MPTGDVTLTINDFSLGTVIVPASSVQVVIGCSTTGTYGQVVATRSIAALQSQFGYGDLVEAASLAIQAGGTVLAIRTKPTAGTASAVTAFATGTSVVTVTLDATYGAFGRYMVKMLIVTGGTTGTAGITFKLSLDAGRNYGPTIALGTAVSYAIAGTGVTLNFTNPATMVAGEFIAFSTVAMAPTLTTAAPNHGIKECLEALTASTYATTGWGSMHIVGGVTAGGMTGSHCDTIQGYLDTMAASKCYARAIVTARDASCPAVYGGTAESEATWYAALITSFASSSDKRVVACAGHYNLPSMIASTPAGSPRYRSPGSWAFAARAVTIPPQRHAGRVRDGSLTQIVVNPSTDPLDGFVYHDERTTPALDAVRLATFRTRIGYPGVFVTNPYTLAPFGSDFALLPRGNVMDIACGLVNTRGQLEINNDVRLNANGTIYEADARAIESSIYQALKDGMIAAGMIDAASVTVDRTTNIASTSTVVIAVTIQSRGYILQETVTIGFATPSA